MTEMLDTVIKTLKAGMDANDQRKAVLLEQITKLQHQQDVLFREADEIDAEQKHLDEAISRLLKKRTADQVGNNSDVKALVEKHLKPNTPKQLKWLDTPLMEKYVEAIHEALEDGSELNSQDLAEAISAEVGNAVSLAKYRISQLFDAGKVPRLTRTREMGGRHGTNPYVYSLKKMVRVEGHDNPELYDNMEIVPKLKQVR